MPLCYLKNDNVYCSILLSKIMNREPMSGDGCAINWIE